MTAMDAKHLAMEATDTKHPSKQTSLMKELRPKVEHLQTQVTYAMKLAEYLRIIQ